MVMPAAMSADLFNTSAPSLLVAGVDEAGRGPLAGPVVAAAVILDPARPITGLGDSKVISEKRRASLALQIRQCAWVRVGIAEPERSTASHIAGDNDGDGRAVRIWQGHRACLIQGLVPKSAERQGT